MLSEQQPLDMQFLREGYRAGRFRPGALHLIAALQVRAYHSLHSRIQKILRTCAM